jgi:hypothetical protein
VSEAGALEAGTKERREGGMEGERGREGGCEGREGAREGARERFQTFFFAALHVSEACGSLGLLLQVLEETDHEVVQMDPRFPWQTVRRASQQELYDHLDEHLWQALQAHRRKELNIDLALPILGEKMDLHALEIAQRKGERERGGEGERGRGRKGEREN